MNRHVSVAGPAISRWRSHALRLLTSLVLGSVTTLLPGASAHADSGSEDIFKTDFCWNYFIAECPDDIDFYWRTGTMFSPGEPPDAHNWASLVNPAGTYVFYSPMPTEKHASWDFGLAGFGWDWWVVPASLWWLDNGVQPGLVLAPYIASTSALFARSSYRQSDAAPSGEPGFMSRTTAFWWGDLWDWYWQCSWAPPGCYQVWHHYRMVAWRTQAHPIPVRQLQPVGVGR